MVRDADDLRAVSRSALSQAANPATSRARFSRRQHGPGRGCPAGSRDEIIGTKRRGRRVPSRERGNGAEQSLSRAANQAASDSPSVYTARGIAPRTVTYGRDGKGLGHTEVQGSRDEATGSRRPSRLAARLKSDRAITHQLHGRFYLFKIAGGANQRKGEDAGSRVGRRKEAGASVEGRPSGYHVVHDGDATRFIKTKYGPFMNGNGPVMVLLGWPIPVTSPRRLPHLLVPPKPRSRSSQPFTNQRGHELAGRQHKVLGAQL